MIGVGQSGLNFPTYPNPVAPAIPSPPPSGPTSGATSAPPTAYALLSAACRRDGARPRLTWYDNDTGERAELSGVTLLNWVHKTANFMIDELFVEPGVSVSLQLPRHWLTAVWWLAAHTVGAHLEVAAPSSELPAGSFDVAVFGPDALPQFAAVEHLVAVALTPMATGFVGAGRPLPAGMTDFETEVRGQPDAFVGSDDGSTDVGSAALDRARQWSLTSKDRLLAAGPVNGADDLVRDLLAPLAADASCVWIRNPEAGKDVQHAVTEHVTVTTMTAPELPAPGGTSGPIRYLT